MDTLNIFKQLVDDRIEIVASSDSSVQEKTSHKTKHMTKKKMTVKSTDNMFNKFVDFKPKSDVEPENPQELMAGLESLGLHNNNPQNVQYAWLNSSNMMYCFGKHKLHPQNLSQFKSISGLMNELNNLSESNSFNSCLVSFYAQGSTSLSSHADNETILDHTSSICNISLGPPRTLEFTDRKKKVLGTVELDNMSMLTMKPGCQENLKHKVLPTG